MNKPAHFTGLRSSRVNSPSGLTLLLLRFVPCGGYACNKCFYLCFWTGAFISHNNGEESSLTALLKYTGPVWPQVGTIENATHRDKQEKGNINVA